MVDRTPNTLLVAFAVIVALLSTPAGAEEDGEIRWVPGEPVELERVGAGDLLWRAPQGLVPLPAVELAVKLDVRGPLVSGELTQRFVNPTAESIEAVYVFPTPAGARVHRMSLTIGERTIRAVVRERGEARRAYRRAHDEGRAAALVASNPVTSLFSTSVANIPSGATVEVRLGWLEELEPDDGRWSLRVPLAYTARLGGGTASGRRVRPTVQLGVTLRAGIPIEDVRSPSHPIVVSEIDRDGGVRIGSPREGLPADADLVIEWRTRLPDRPQPFVVLEQTDQATYATAMIWPPRATDDGSYGLATETVFVIDVSGSMSGPSIDQARRALAASLERMRPGDRFNIIRFNQESTAMFEDSRTATAQQVAEAVAGVLAMQAGGGTQIHGALSHALDLLERSGGSAESRIVLLTDGAAPRSDLLLEEISRRLGRSRLHAIGIGNAPNGELLRALAGFGRGTSAFIGADEQIESGVERFFRRLERPVFADIELVWEGLHPDLAPSEPIPDVYAGRPLWVHARLDDVAPSGRLLVRGRLPSGTTTLELPINATTPRATGLATRWAGARIERLLESLVGGADESDVRRAVVDLGIRHGVVSPYTSLVAVDDRALSAAARHTARLQAALPRGGSVGPMRRLIAALLGSIGLALVLATGFWRPRCAG